MSANDVFTEHLKALAQRLSWRIRELPSEITDDVLRVLDERGWVEFRLWERVDPNPKPLVNSDPATFVVRPDDYCGWFSPRKDPRIVGDLSAVLASGANDPELSPEVRVSECGKAAVAELAVALTDPESPRNDDDTPSANVGKPDRPAHHSRSALSSPAAANRSPAQNADEAVRRLGKEWATYSELAGVTGKSEAAVRSAIYRAKQAERLTDEDERDIPDSRPGTARIEFRVRAVWKHIAPARERSQ